MPEISAILTCHREGLLLGPSLRSFQQAIEHARAGGLSVEPIVVLDRADPITRAMVDAHDHDLAGVHEIDANDPALSRNHGALRATGTFVSYLDGDDLWGFNWLLDAYRFCAAQTVPVIAHSQVNVVFGDARGLWWHPDSLSPGTDIDFQRIGNYWDAMCFTTRAVALDQPYRANDIAAGYGHEDWYWNNITLAAGIAHRPVPGTVHMKRRRPHSQMARCWARGAVPFASALSRY